MQVRDIMTRDPIYCLPETNLQIVAKMMVERNCGEIPIVESNQNQKPVGVVTDRDICCRAVAKGRNPLELTAEDVMSMPCVSVGEADSLEQCCEVLEENQIRRVVVVSDDGSIIGVVSQGDIARVAPEMTERLLAQVSETSAEPSAVSQ